MPAQVQLDTKSEVNVMSKGMFRKLRLGKFKFFTSDAIPLQIGDFKFCGQFTARIEANGNMSYANFFVRESEESCATINSKMAKQLKLIDG